MDAMTLRFQEFEYYDITEDIDVVRMEAITHRGTFWSEVEAAAKDIGAKRKAFETVVLHKMALGQYPDAFNLDEACEEIGIGECFRGTNS